MHLLKVRFTAAAAAATADAEGDVFVDFTPADDDNRGATFLAGSLDNGDAVAEVFIPVLPLLPAMEMRELFSTMLEEYHLDHPELRHVDEAAVYQLHFLPFVRDLFSVMSAGLLPMLPGEMDGVDAGGGLVSYRLRRVVNFLSSNNLPHCVRMVWGAVTPLLSDLSPPPSGDGVSSEGGGPGGGALQGGALEHRRGGGTGAGGMAYPMSPDDVMLAGGHQHQDAWSSDNEEQVSLPSPYSLLPSDSPEGARGAAAAAETPAARSLLHLLLPPQQL